MLYTLIHPRRDLERPRQAARHLGIPQVREVLPNPVDARTGHIRGCRVGAASVLSAQLRVLLRSLKHGSHLGESEKDTQQIVQCSRLNLRVGQPAR